MELQQPPRNLRLRILYKMRPLRTLKVLFENIINIGNLVSEGCLFFLESFNFKLSYKKLLIEISKFPSPHDIGVERSRGSTLSTTVSLLLSSGWEIRVSGPIGHHPTFAVRFTLVVATSAYVQTGSHGVVNEARALTTSPAVQV